MKYLIVKGSAGFGDRLQCLKMCVRFALDNNLQVFVDWSDPIWSHNGESFYTYFNLVNVPVLKSIDDIPEDATVYPSFWQGKLKTTFTEDMGLIPGVHIGFLNNQQFTEDVVVHCSIGERWIYRDSDFFGDVLRVIDHRIIRKVRERQQRHDLKNTTGIHLRGTDRANRINKDHRMCALNIRLMNMGLLNGTKFVAVSDDPEYITIWKARYPAFPVLTEAGNLGGNQGVHLRSKESLTVSKDTLNVDLLVDFFTLASCRSVLSTSKDSRFAQEAQRLSIFINKMLS